MMMSRHPFRRVLDHLSDTPATAYWAGSCYHHLVLDLSPDEVAGMEVGLGLPGSQPNDE